jgi:acetate kinase
MGMTPLEGLVMGTRSGDLDPGVVLRLVDSAGLSPGDVETLLNRDSGLRALAGSADMRDLEARATAGDARAEEALAVFCYRVKKYIGAYVAALGGIDALVFTGGIGENSAGVRARSCAGLETLGIALDEAANRQHRREIHTGAVPVLVVRTDEEHAIARATLQVLRDGQTETCGDDPTFRHGR